MNISGPSSLTSLTALQGVSTASSTNVDDAQTGTGHVHHHHGGGQMKQALAQALQSLGLAADAGTLPAKAPAQNGAATDPDGDGDVHSASNLKQDMRQFMHALFQAVQGNAATSNSSNQGQSASDNKASFATGLSAVISQVSAGNAPTGLQNAFSKLVTDLKSNASNADTGAASGASSTATSAPSLQALLTKLQASLGYGASGAVSTGNLLSNTA